MTASPTAVELTVAAARAAADKKAEEIIALDVSERLVLTDAFLVASASTERQVGAIVDGIEEALHARGVKALRREGVGQNRWVLLDFGDLIAHVQHSEDREFYALERLWRDCPVITLPDDVRHPAPAGPEA
ncbi:ribosome silencing factor [Miniimonas arenae]|uniref:Ribosomal silencing factor RsfS n=1 Tax=Miniimonas arenae TaxID=676201 RepID=A0A5C5BBT6_9MICO|nr:MULTISPECIES: ribosome silencing factor [Miniimonas]TNU74023.1 ribosome silencing factor [Miniimonas arenae]